VGRLFRATGCKRELKDPLKQMQSVTSKHLTYYWLSWTDDHRCTKQDSFLTGWHTTWTK